MYQMADDLRKSANVAHLTDKRKDSLFNLVDTDGSGTIDAQEFAVLYDAIKKDLAEELEREAALQKEASSARRRVKMLLLFVMVLVSFLAASVAANFAVIFTVVDKAVQTTTTSTGLLEVKGSDMIAKTAIATQDLPLMAAPALDLETLAEVRSLKVTYSPAPGATPTKAHMVVIGVRKHNNTFVEFVTDVHGETVEAFNGMASLVRYPTLANGLQRPRKFEICAANATCSAFSASGIDAQATIELAKAALEEIGLHDNARRLQADLQDSCDSTGYWTTATCSSESACGGVAEAKVMYFTGYSSTRHVVFFLHGFTETYGAMWDAFCVTGVCDGLTDDAFRHLMFAFPTSSMQATWGSTTGPSWTTDLLDTTTFSLGGVDLATFMCGDSAWATGGSCGTSGFLTGLGADDTSEVMMVGFSNGGAMSIYGNWYYPGTVTKAVAIDYYGAEAGSASPDYFVQGATMLDVKVYMACGSATYGTNGIFDDAILTAATVTSDGMAPATYGSLAFQEWSYSSSVASFKFAVHGLDPSDSSICASPTTPGGSTSGWAIHSAMLDAVKDACIDDILDWVTPPPDPTTPTGPGAPSPPAYVAVPVMAVPAPLKVSYGITPKMVINRKTERVSKLDLPTKTRSPRWSMIRF